MKCYQKHAVRNIQMRAMTPSFSRRKARETCKGNAEEKANTSQMSQLTLQARKDAVKNSVMVNTD